MGDGSARALVMLLYMQGKQTKNSHVYLSHLKAKKAKMKVELDITTQFAAHEGVITYHSQK